MNMSSSEACSLLCLPETGFIVVSFWYENEAWFVFLEHVPRLDSSVVQSPSTRTPICDYGFDSDRLPSTGEEEDWKYCLHELQQFMDYDIASYLATGTCLKDLSMGISNRPDGSAITVIIYEIVKTQPSMEG